MSKENNTANTAIHTVQALEFRPVGHRLGQLPPRLGLYETYLQVKPRTKAKFCQELFEQSQASDTPPSIFFYDACGITQIATVISAEPTPSPFSPEENGPEFVRLTVWLTREQIYGIYPNFSELSTATDISY